MELKFIQIATSANEDGESLYGLDSEGNVWIQSYKRVYLTVEEIEKEDKKERPNKNSDQIGRYKLVWGWVKQEMSVLES